MTVIQILTLMIADSAMLRCRLDQALMASIAADGHIHDFVSRTALQRLIRAGQTTVNGVVITDPDFMVEAGTLCTIIIPPAVPTHMLPENVPLNVVYEDNDLIVVNKPAGMVVHPGAGCKDGTLVNALLAHCHGSLSGIGGITRPGIVHRLDKDTSGLIVVAKNDAAHHGLAAQFADRSLSRTYTAIVHGIPMPLVGRIDAPIGRHPRLRLKMAVVRHGGRTAATNYSVIDSLANGKFSVVECKLETGRTHQIRVHMAHIRYPLVGDPMYGKSGCGKELHIDRQALHAAAIKFVHPCSGKHLRFSCPLPSDMSELLDLLRKDCVGSNMKCNTEDILCRP